MSCTTLRSPHPGRREAEEVFLPPERHLADQESRTLRPLFLLSSQEELLRESIRRSSMSWEGYGWFGMRATSCVRSSMMCEDRKSRRIGHGERLGRRSRLEGGGAIFSKCLRGNTEESVQERLEYNKSPKQGICWSCICVTSVRLRRDKGAAFLATWHIIYPIGWHFITHSLEWWTCHGDKAIS